MISRLVLLFLLVPSVFLLSSCVEGEEEIWINLNGSGKVVAKYEIPSIVLGKIGDPNKIVNALNLIAAKEEGIDITKCSFTKDGSKTVFQLEGKFKNILELFEIAGQNENLFSEKSEADSDKIAGILGDFDFRLEGIRPALDREIRPTEIFPEIVSKKPGMLGASTFKYIIHLPVKARETNAHAISKDGKTVSWTFRLKDQFQTPMTISVDTEIPWWVWLLLVIAVSIAIGCVWFFFRLIWKLLLFSRDRRLAEKVNLAAP